MFSQLVGFLEVDVELRIANLSLMTLAERGSIAADVV